MRVSPISDVNYSFRMRNNEGETKQPAFKGLWGKVTSSATEDEIWDYHPFMNESQEEINAKISSKTYSYDINDCYRESVFESLPCEYYNVSAKVAQRLPFTTSEWGQYTKNKFGLKKNVRNFIEEALRRFNLKQHLIK